MTIEAARGFHERLSTDAAFRAHLEAASESEAQALIVEAGFRFSASDWARLLEELAVERSTVVAAREALSRDRCEEAYRVISHGRRECPRSWILLEMEAAVMGRLGRTQEAIDMLSGLTPDAPCLAPLAPPERERTLAVLAFTLGYLACPPEAVASPTGDTFDPHPRHADSGWRTDPAPEARFVRRPLDVRSALDVDEFMAEYACRNRPVICSGLTETWPAWDDWRRHALLAKYGRAPIEIHASRQASAFRKHARDAASRQVTLDEFVTHYMELEHESWYLFKVFEDRLFWNDFTEPAIFGERFRREYRDDDATLFYVGGRGTGLNHHQHPAAWNALVFGYKLWSLLTPLGVHRFENGGIDPGDVSAAGDGLRIVFVQCPGEVVFVPQFWPHATCNLTDCVGVAREVGLVDGLFDRLCAEARPRAIQPVRAARCDQPASVDLASVDQDAAIEQRADR